MIRKKLRKFLEIIKNLNKIVLDVLYQAGRITKGGEK